MQVKWGLTEPVKLVPFTRTIRYASAMIKLTYQIGIPTNRNYSWSDELNRLMTCNYKSSIIDGTSLQGFQWKLSTGLCPMTSTALLPIDI